MPPRRLQLRHGAHTTVASVMRLAALGIGTAVARAAPLAGTAGAWIPHLLEEDEPAEEPGSPNFWIKIAFSGLLVLIGGVFSGLTLGLMGLEPTNLRVLRDSGEDHEKDQAAKVLKLLEKGKHWVLVVLLLSNTVVNESLPIFLDSAIGGGIAAVLISTSLIVIFGEIIPPVCSRYGLSLGAKSTPFVLALMYLEWPIAYPIAKLLDWLLGESEGNAYRKAELKTFVRLHRYIGEETLSDDEVTIISAVLDLGTKTVGDIMTPIADTYCLSDEAILDQDAVDEIVSLGFSRVPVYSAERRDNFLGMLLVKKLVSYDPNRCDPVRNFPLSVLPETDRSVSVLDILNFFQEGRSHMVLVSESPGSDTGGIGVVTLEDVMEALLGEEIVDETDNWINVAKRVKVVRTERRAKTQGLQPIVRSIIERKKARLPASPNPRPNGLPPIQAAVKPQPKAFNKARVAELRSSKMQPGLSRNDSVPVFSNTARPDTPPKSASEHGGNDEEADERTSLLRRRLS